jgi:hypothetical protein
MMKTIFSIAGHPPPRVTGPWQKRRFIHLDTEHHVRIIARLPSIQFTQAPARITGTIAPDRFITGHW